MHCTNVHSFVISWLTVTFTATLVTHVEGCAAANTLILLECELEGVEDEEDTGMEGMWSGTGLDGIL